ncbi:AfsR/SARP family transcriptional regulator [Flindersiella endophytica]
MLFGVLGPVIANDGSHTIAPRGLKQAILLAVLLSRANSGVSADLLAEALWGQSPPRSSDNMLRWHVHQLRKSLADDSRVVRHTFGYQIVVEPDELDAVRFQRLYAEARASMDGGDVAQASAVLHQALGLWRGSAYGELTVQVEAGLLDDEVARLDELRLSAFHLQVDADLRLGRHDAVTAQLRRLAVEHPLREGFRAQLMLALYRSGRQAEALEVYRDTRRLLLDELGIDPGPQLRQLEQAILTADPALELSAPPIQVQPASVVNGPAELPIPPPGFTGRSAEIGRLTSLLTEEGAAVVICGPGGIGKSATAVQLAHRLADGFPDGQLYVNLHSSTPGAKPIDPSEVLPRFLRSLGADGAELGGASVDELATAYRSAIASKRVLILLDDAAGTSQIWPLLPGTASCAVVITARRALSAGLPHFRLLPLPEHDAEALLTRVAGDERAPGDPATIAEISGLCDGLPLALCVSGARLVARPGWSWERFAERLRDECRRLDELVDGDRAVRASFGVSYRDLREQPSGAEAARLFRLIGLLDVLDLGVPAAAAIADRSLPQAEILLDALVDAQLMDNDVPGRYRMHDLLRLFARECARAEEAEPDRSAALRRAFEFYLATARTAARIVEPMSEWRVDCEPSKLLQSGADLAGRDDVRRWVELEHGNLLEVVKQAADFPGDGPAIAVGLAAALLSPLAHAGMGMEQAGFNRIASDVAATTGDAVHLAITAFVSGLVLHAQQPQEAVANLCAARDLWQDLGRSDGEAAALRHLGTTYGSLGRYDLALDCIDASLLLARAIGDPYAEASGLGHQGLAYQRLGRKQEAIAAYAKSLELYRKLGHRSGEVIAAGCLSTGLHVFGELDAALRTYEQALELARVSGHRLVEAECLWGRSEILHERGDRVRATESRRQSVDLLVELGWIGREEKAAIVADPCPAVPAGFWTNI